MRPLLWPSVREKRRYPPWESFPLGVVVSAVNMIEFGDLDVDEAVSKAVSMARSPLHPVAAAWVRHACMAYVRASVSLAEELAKEGVRLVPQSRARVVQGRSSVGLRVLTAWGRWYESEDGRVREFRRLRISRASKPEAPSTSAMAFVAGMGHRAARNVYSDLPVPVLGDEAAPTRVRVVEVVLNNSEPPRVLVDMSRVEAQRLYEVQAKPAARAVIERAGPVPGKDCGQCKVFRSCGTLPRIPGLLGLEGPGTHTRIWSVSTGRQYEVCPAQAHLRDLNLLGQRDDDNAAIRRGRAVHAWLLAAHSRRDPARCQRTDLPDPESADIGLAAGVMTREEYREAWPFLLNHVDVCPLSGPGVVTDVRPEPEVAVHDTTADVLVMAAPDLLRRVDGRAVYREQKTASRPLEDDGIGVFRRYPQLALAVCLMSAGVFDDAREEARSDGLVELEVMTRTGVSVMTLDPADPVIHAAARRTVSDLAQGWHRDTVFPTNPGGWCTVCPATDWCPDAVTSPTQGQLVIDGMVIDIETGEVIQTTSEPTSRAAAVADVIGEPTFGAYDEPV